MTRINVVDPKTLSDAWLVAEYRELPRAIKSNCNITNAPERYKLSTGHVKWAKKHSLFLIKRFERLIEEMKYRGFTTNFNTDGLKSYIGPDTNNDYKVTEKDIKVNIDRLKERFNSSSNKHKWTKRAIPNYLKREYYE